MREHLPGLSACPVRLGSLEPTVFGESPQTGPKEATARGVAQRQ